LVDAKKGRAAPMPRGARDAASTRARSRRARGTIRKADRKRKNSQEAVGIGAAHTHNAYKVISTSFRMLFK
ncbi:hypothetical protein, partial [Paraburkholderia sp. Ac-20347]|uniref:hypothetical protein n=1 Tax=Paraburkholderia sp. Ac-20347 TaxID=2703892 RepID=UPI00198134BB